MVVGLIPDLLISLWPFNELVQGVTLPLPFLPGDSSGISWWDGWMVVISVLKKKTKTIMSLYRRKFSGQLVALTNY